MSYPYAPDLTDRHARLEALQLAMELATSPDVSTDIETPEDVISVAASFYSFIVDDGMMDAD